MHPGNPVRRKQPAGTIVRDGCFDASFAVGGIGHATTLGLAFAPFAILFSFWIPTLALLFAAVTLVTGALDLRGSTGLRRRVALLSVGLGLAAIALAVIVVVVTSGPPSGDAVISVPPPG